MRKLIFIVTLFCTVPVMAQRYVTSDGQAVLIVNSDVPQREYDTGDGGEEEPSSDSSWYYISADYYVCAVDGDDSNDGTSRDYPIKTLSKLNTIISNSTQGIKVAISDTAYYGTIEISGKTGSSSDYYEIIGCDKFGKGRPNIMGFKEFTSWTDEGGNLYSKSDSELPATEEKTLVNPTSWDINYIIIMNAPLFDGVQHGIAQTPNSGYYDMEDAGDSGDDSWDDWFQDDDEISCSADEFIGAYAYIGTEDWVANKVRITDNTASPNATFYLNSPQFDHYNMDHMEDYWNELPYKIVNDTPDAEKEWEYDYSTQTITIYSTTDPANMTIQVPVGDSIISVYQSDYVKIKHLNVWGGNFASIMLRESDEVEVDSCGIYYPAFAGVLNMDQEDTKLTYITIRDGQSNGIYSRQSSSGTKMYIEHCDIRDMGALEYMGDRDGHNYNGVAFYYNRGDHWIRYNYIDSVGYIGINCGISQDTPKPDTSVVYGNYIEDALFHLHDGSSIYTYGNEDYYKVVNNNIVMNPETNVNFRRVSTSMRVGLYFDDSSEWWVADSNTVHNSSYCFLNQNATSRGTYRYNVVVDVTHTNAPEYANAGFYRNRYGNLDNSDTTVWTNNTVIVTDADTGMVFSWAKDLTPDFDGMDIDYNTYDNPFRSDGKILQLHEYDGSSYTTTFNTLSEWQTEMGWDMNSTSGAAGWDYSDVSGVTIDEFIGHFINWSPTTHEFNLGDCTFVDMSGNDVTGSVSVPPYYSKVLYYKSGTLSTVDDELYKGQ